ncbi:type III-B CRISPR module RAMP protein Cmr6 [Aliarcobacter butzleri]
MGIADAFANMNKSKKEISNENKKNSSSNVEKKDEQKKFIPKPNIGWLFYKDYFSSLDEKDYKLMLLSKDEKKQKELEIKALELKINDKVLNIIEQRLNQLNIEELGNSSFSLKTTYPGLLIGSGNTHELPDIKGQAILGFHFDYTSGIPQISGSSIKGLLRSAFEYEGYIKELLEEQKINIENVKDLEIEIFGQENKSNEVNQGTDIFFDASIIKGTPNKKILVDDFITPHKEATKNPIPLRFLKVLPEVTFKFEFLLQDGIIKKEEKTKLFKNIILDFGLGAKTNVGYGKFQEIEAKS